MKLKERVLLGVSAATVLATLLLVVDLQLELGVSGRHLLPSHGRHRLAPHANTFRHRVLQRAPANGSEREASNSSEAAARTAAVAVAVGRAPTEGPHDEFSDLVDYVANNGDVGVVESSAARLSAAAAELFGARRNPTMAELVDFPDR
ncbi:extracellular serine/threonine protein CG31145-like [Schistocerca cancellata]|uniref:extracellular serine/threonine protein CG31145-like n=1 Tax=Schistocerca cancellata TaxID=274614 RepID=UPI0021192227|nr:extracellular serine/threonine protein CG31145-like [Schistocerca cancellata]